MMKKIDAWDKSKLNLRHKIIRLKYVDTAGDSTVYDRCRVISVNLEAPGISIVTEEGYNVILEGLGGSYMYEIIGTTVESEESRFNTKELEKF
jgi:hypothetical protein